MTLISKSGNPRLNTTVLDIPHETERRKQLEYGREKLTLSDKTGMQAKPPQFVDRRKVKKSGHEAGLAKVVAERRKVCIAFLDGTNCEGDLLEFDKYSMRVKDESGVIAWFFKSSMKGFREVE